MRVTKPQPGCAVVVLAGALTIFAQVAQSQTPFSETIKNWSSLALQGSGHPVQDMRMSAGHVLVTLTSGSVSSVAAGGEVVGVFFVGTGNLEYTTADPVELPIVTYNIKNDTSLKPISKDKGLVIRESFSEVLWLSEGVTLPTPPPEAAGTQLDRPFAAHMGKFGHIYYVTPPAHRFTAWRLNGENGPLVRAEFSGGSEDLLYTLDGTEARAETLYTLHKNKALPDRLDPVVLSSQPFGSNRRVPIVPRVVLTNVDLVLTASDGKDAALTVTETFAGLRGRTGVLLLDLYDTMFGRSTLDPRHLHVKGIFDDSGTPLPFDHAKDELAVGLRTPLVPGAKARLRFELEGDILYRPEGDNYWELGTGPWFPQPDLGAQYYTVHATVKVKKPFIALMPGKTVRRAEEGDSNVLETRVEKPVQFMVVLAGKYAFEEETKDGITVRVASYGMKNTRAIRKLINLAQKIITYYQGFLGPFPFDEFNVIEINDLGWGQAPPGVMFITSEAFSPIGEPLNELFSKGINERFAHEIAHQYWGHVVKMPSVEEQWLTESFAEMCAGLVIRDLRGKSDFNGLIATWKDRAKQATDTAPIPLANRISDESDSRSAWMQRTYLLYFKGPWLLNSIREQIGDRAFLVFLRSCQSNLEWKFGSTEIVERVLEAVTKDDWKPFFDANYWGTAMPAK
jgi:hypothetical protein